MPRPIKLLSVTGQQRTELETMINRPTAEQRMVRRCRLILCRAEGLSQEETAEKVGISRPAVNAWEKRFAAEGMEGLIERKRSGRRPSLNEKVKQEIITEATRPPKGRTQWTTRSMAKAKGVSNQTVHRLWKSNESKPHLTRTFKVSNDKHFEEKFWYVIGLYLQLSDCALVLCCDEKSQCQALERTQPGLPLGLGHIRTRTHDYTRHGTLTLFAAMNYLDGKIFHNTAARHTHVEWLAFLKQIDAETPGDLTLHLIVDNYCRHKHHEVRSWLKWRNQRHRKASGIDRVAMHFTPTSSSWMNMAERFFRDITVDCVRDGSFASVKELKDSILDYLNERNLNPKPYVWKAEGKSILEKIQRAKAAMPPRYNVNTLVKHCSIVQHSC